MYGDIPFRNMHVYIFRNKFKKIVNKQTKNAGYFVVMMENYEYLFITWYVKNIVACV
jgi:hypothetical protein